MHNFIWYWSTLYWNKIKGPKNLIQYIMCHKQHCQADFLILPNLKSADIRPLFSAFFFKRKQLSWPACCFFGTQSPSEKEFTPRKKSSPNLNGCNMQYAWQTSHTLNMFQTTEEAEGDVWVQEKLVTAPPPPSPLLPHFNTHTHIIYYWPFQGGT